MTEFYFNKAKHILVNDIFNIHIVSHQVYCDMTPGGQVWTLIARFSNNDTKNWMNDSGYWWYDKTKAVRETTDQSNNTDMILLHHALLSLLRHAL